MISEIIHSVELFKHQIAELRKKAPDYPKVHFEMKGRETWITTMVTFEYEGAQYKRHHVECGILNNHYNLTSLHAKLIDACQQSMEFGQPVGLDDLILPANDKTEG